MKEWLIRVLRAQSYTESRPLGMRCHMCSLLRLKLHHRLLSFDGGGRTTTFDHAAPLDEKIEKRCRRRRGGGRRINAGSAVCHQYLNLGGNRTSGPIGHQTIKAGTGKSRAKPARGTDKVCQLVLVVLIWDTTYDPCLIHLEAQL